MSLIDSNPTFTYPYKGKYNQKASFKSLNIGSDAYVTEQELNEMQFINSEQTSNLIREITNSGVITENPELDDENNLVKKVETKNSQKVQITLKGSDCKFVSYAIAETTTTYYQEYTYNGMALKAGDSIVEKSTSYENSNLYAKNVTVKPVSIDDCLLGSMI